MQAQGESLRRSQENARTEQMFGLSADRKMAADRARQTARSQFIGGLGQAVGGVAGIYLQGGDRAGLFRQDGAGIVATQQPPRTTGTAPTGVNNMAQADIVNPIYGEVSKNHGT